MNIDSLLTELLELAQQRPARHAVQIASITHRSSLTPPHTLWAMTQGASPSSVSATTLASEALAHQFGVSHAAALAWTRGDAPSPHVHLHLRSWTVWTDSPLLPPLSEGSNHGLGRLLDALAHSDPSHYTALCRRDATTHPDLTAWLTEAVLVEVH